MCWVEAHGDARTDFDGFIAVDDDWEDVRDERLTARGDFNSWGNEVGNEAVALACRRVGWLRDILGMEPDTLAFATPDDETLAVNGLEG